MNWTIIFGVLMCVFAFLFIVTMLMLVVALVFAIRYGRMALAWESNINESLDILDQAYNNMAKIQNQPLFINSPEVVVLMNQITNCREAILTIANAMMIPAKDRIASDTL